MACCMESIKDTATFATFMSKLFCGPFMAASQNAAQFLFSKYLGPCFDCEYGCCTVPVARNVLGFSMAARQDSGRIRLLKSFLAFVEAIAAIALKLLLIVVALPVAASQDMVTYLISRQAWWAILSVSSWNARGALWPRSPSYTAVVRRPSVRESFFST